MYKRRREKLYEQMKLQDKEGAGSGQGSSRARGDLGGRDYFSTVDFVPPAPVDLLPTIQGFSQSQLTVRCEHDHSFKHRFMAPVV